MKPLPLFCILLAILASSCNKKETYGQTTLNGQVTTCGTSLGIPGALLILYETENKGFYPSVTPILNTYADSFGDYSMSFYAHENREYSIRISAAKHFNMDNYLEYFRVTKLGKKSKLDLSICGYAFTKFRLINNSTAKGIRFEALYNINGKPFWPAFKNSKDTTFWASMPGTATVKVPYYIDYPDTTIPRSVTKQFIFNDTTSVDIEY